MTDTIHRDLPGDREVPGVIERYGKAAMVAAACLAVCGALYFTAIFLLARQ
jgi:hypothetical protein